MRNRGYTARKLGRTVANRFLKTVGAVAAGKVAARTLKRKRKVSVKATSKKRAATRTKKMIRSVVANTLNRTKAVGKFSKRYVGEMNWSQITPNQQVVFDAGLRNWTNSGDYTAPALRFNAFDVHKLLDAASVLYNGKTKNINYRLTPQNFDPKDLTVNFAYCSWEITISNQSYQDFECIWYEGHAIETQNIKLYDCWQRALTNMNWVGGQEQLISMGAKIRKELDEVHRNFKVVAKKFRLAPGAKKTFKYTFKGPVNFTKALSNESLVTFMKGVSKSFCIVAMAQEAAYYGAGGYVGLKGQTDQYLGGVVQGIVYEQKETYHVVQPDLVDDQYEGNVNAIICDYPNQGVDGNVNFRRFIADKKNEYQYTV